MGRTFLRTQLKHRVLHQAICPNKAWIFIFQKIHTVLQAVCFHMGWTLLKIQLQLQACCRTFCPNMGWLHLKLYAVLQADPSHMAWTLLKLQLQRQALCQKVWLQFQAMCAGGAAARLKQQQLQLQYLRQADRADTLLKPQAHLQTMCQDGAKGGLLKS